MSRIALYPANLFGSFKSQDGPSPCLCVSMCEISVIRREGRHLFCQPYLHLVPVDLLVKAGSEDALPLPNQALRRRIRKVCVWSWQRLNLFVVCEEPRHTKSPGVDPGKSNRFWYYPYPYALSSSPPNKV